MRVQARAATLFAGSAAMLAVTAWGASAAFGSPASDHAGKRVLVVFSAQHVRGASGEVLVEGKGLVVYTFRGDRPGRAAACTGQCAVIWPAVRGVPVMAHGVKIHGKFGMINGQVTFNGRPLYLFTGEKPKASHADSEFRVVPVITASGGAPVPMPTVPPTPAPSPTHW
jgi:predicted lipoprotein with Yx(FWY)xxD motif